MRYAIVSDIHSNLQAFESVLVHAERQGYDMIWCLGDLTGYGPRPNECVDLLRRHPHLCIVGNHDLAAIDRIDLATFSTDAAVAARWTQKTLRPDVRAFLSDLPTRRMEGVFTLVHGSPRKPLWEYLVSASQAESNLAYFDTPYCLVGHSHLPVVFRCLADGERCSMEKTPSQVALGSTEVRLIINPGSVGQPRDHDARSSYALLDTEQGMIWYHRVEYDVAAVQDEIYDAGLPEFLAERLSFGW